MSGKDRTDLFIRLVQLAVDAVLSIFVAAMVHDLVVAVAGHGAETYAILAEMASFFLLLFVFHRITSKFLQT